MRVRENKKEVTCNPLYKRAQRLLTSFKTLGGGGPSKSSLGFSLVSALILAAFFSLVATMIVSILTHQYRSVRSIKQQISRMNVEYLIRQTMSRSDACTCLFTGTDSPYPYVINPGAEASKEGEEAVPPNFANNDDLNSIKNGCESTAIDIIEEGEPPLSGLKSQGQSDESGLIVSKISIDSDSLEDISGGSTRQWSGQLRIEYTSNPRGNRAIRDTVIPLVFQVDSLNQITQCWGEEDHSCYLASIDETGAHGNTLVGCGGTSNLGEKRRSAALGFGAGAKFGTTGDPATDGVFIGYEAGSNVPSGKNIIFIGSKAGKDRTTPQNNQFVIGSPGHEEWITGDMTTSTLMVGEEEVALDEDLAGLEEQLEIYENEIKDAIEHEHGAPHKHMCTVDFQEREVLVDDDRNEHPITGQKLTLPIGDFYWPDWSYAGNSAYSSIISCNISPGSHEKKRIGTPTCGAVEIETVPCSGGSPICRSGKCEPCDETKDCTWWTCNSSHTGERTCSYLDICPYDIQPKPCTGSTPVCVGGRSVNDICEPCSASRDCRSWTCDGFAKKVRTCRNMDRCPDYPLEEYCASGTFCESGRCVPCSASKSCNPWGPCSGSPKTKTRTCPRTKGGRCTGFKLTERCCECPSWNDIPWSWGCNWNGTKKVQTKSRTCNPRGCGSESKEGSFSGCEHGCSGGSCNSAPTCGAGYELVNGQCRRKTQQSTGSCTTGHTYGCDGLSRMSCPAGKTGTVTLPCPCNDSSCRAVYKCCG